MFIGGIVAWQVTSKEELPDITFNVVRVSTTYVGASADDVEVSVTKPLEDVIQGLDGVYRITSTSSTGQSSISVELSADVRDIDQVVTEIQRQVATVTLPPEVRDNPTVRVFETSKKAIIDIAIYNDEMPLLDVASRRELQQHVRGLENRLVQLPDVFEVRRSGYLVEAITINADPNLLRVYDVPLSTIAQEVQRNNVRAPSGVLQSGRNEQVTILSELDSKAALDLVVVQGGFDSTPIRLSALAHVADAFEPQATIYKVNGREAVMLNVVKSSQVGILEALKSVRQVVDQYHDGVLATSPVTLTYLDDESIDVKNRLSIVLNNGLIGFGLILVTLFIFLNKRSGIWVALGIPFTLCATLIGGYALGYSINGVTLAGIIIVLGIVVDDAIIVAENISRKLNEGHALDVAATNGTAEVIAPILASIITTCLAFTPLFFFSGRFTSFVSVIPPIIFLMLIASVIESFFLLPSHMTLVPKSRNVAPTKRWFERWETAYESALQWLLPKRYLIIGVFILVLVGAGWVASSQFKFVMFPDAESREIVVSGQVVGATSSQQTARAIQPLEDYLVGYIGQEGVGLRSTIARGRRGGVALENHFSMTLELVAADQREKSISMLINEIKQVVERQNVYTNVRFRKRRWGQDSGSPLEIVVQENDDETRDAVVAQVITLLKQNPNVSDVQEDIVPSKKAYSIQYDQEKLKTLSVSPTEIATTLRTVLTGRRLYTIFRDDDEVDVTLTVDAAYRADIHAALKVPVANQQGYLVPLHDLVSVTPINAKSSRRRRDLKRTSYVDADLIESSSQSPVQVAEAFEATHLPALLAQYPSAHIRFEGEVLDTREAKRSFMWSIVGVLGLIYMALALLFNSILKPFRVLVIIPFGLIGVIGAFYSHGKLAFGFYAAIGTLGMLGVVVNDAIVMLNKLDTTAQEPQDDTAFTASVAKTRLRAIVLTTLTTVMGVIPTAYGIGGMDTMLSDMMLALAWGLIVGTAVTLVLTPCVYLIERDIRRIARR